MLMPNGPAAAVGLAIGAKGGVHAPVSACASGAEAIRWGLDLLRFDRADVVLVGGTEACIHPLPMAGFAAMRAMSTRNDEPERASRPFDKGRDGFVLGEGAAALVLERADAAKARGARIHARLAGAGGTADGYDLVAPHPEGEGAARAITAALRDAGLTPADIGHVNAHATSTPVGDTAEAAAIRSSLGEHVMVSATKSQTGHLLGAAGALESVFTILALREQIVPGTANLDDPDDDASVQALDIVRNEPRRATFSAAVNDSFGFGGHNIALVFTTAWKRTCDDRTRRTDPDRSRPAGPRGAAAPVLRRRLDAAADGAGHLRGAHRPGHGRGLAGHRLLHRCHGHGRGDGCRRLPAHRRRHRHGAARAGADRGHLALRRRPAGRGRRPRCTPSARCSPRWCAPRAGSRRSRWCSARRPVAPPTAPPSPTS